MTRLARAVRASVPVRTCDIGGWTDTWYGGPGKVLNIAVSPGVEVVLRPPDGSPRGTNDRLVQAALDEYPTPDPVDVEVCAGVPPGSALGTSSAVAVALIGALIALRGEDLAPALVASAAHRLETEVLGEECGVQDQLCAAHGGISFITVDGYPSATVERLPAWPQLEGLLSTVYLGQPHVSSQMHREVIERGNRSVFERMRVAASAARVAVEARDLGAFASAMASNYEAQRDLHEEVVGVDAAGVIDLARSSGALGWKVNGAGGDGGSVAVVHASAAGRAKFEEDVAKTGRWRVLPLRLCSDGLVVEVSPPGS